MILVDSSVWIAHFRDESHLPEVAALRDTLRRELVLVGDLVLLELLQGAPTERAADALRAAIRRHGVTPLMTNGMPERAARNYRLLRTRGATVRKLVDLVIGTFCIETGSVLLHRDRDFQPMVVHLGLQSVTQYLH